MSSINAAFPVISLSVATITLIASLGTVGSARASQAPEQAQAQSQAAQPRVFASDAGLVLNFVKPDKAADFEMVMGKLREALLKSDKPERRQQGESWKIYRALEPGAGGNVLFVFVMAPPVKDADYTVSTILAEAYPSEVQDLYRKFAESYASGQNIVNLKAVGTASPQP